MSTYHHGGLRAAVLRAAGKLLEKQGTAKLSLREAARRAKVSHNAPYRHFRDRESLLAALAAEGFALLAKELEGRSGREMGEAYVRFALGHPQRFRLMFGGLLRLDSLPELRSRAQATHAALEGAFSWLGVEAPKAAAAAWSLVHGLALLLLDGHFAEAQREWGGAELFASKILGALRFAVGAQRSA